MISFADVEDAGEAGHFTDAELREIAAAERADATYVAISVKMSAMLARARVTGRGHWRQRVARARVPRRRGGHKVRATTASRPPDEPPEPPPQPTASSAPHENAGDAPLDTMTVLRAEPGKTTAKTIIQNDDGTIDIASVHRWAGSFGCSEPAVQIFTTSSKSSWKPPTQNERR